MGAAPFYIRNKQYSRNKCLFPPALVIYQLLTELEVTGSS